MYNRFQKYLKDQNLSYVKKFEFKIGHSTDHVIAHLADQIFQ